MSSADFEKVLVKDDRLLCTDKIKYAVVKGGQNITPSQFKATSASTSSIVFNIQVPSEQTIISREVLLRSTVQLAITTTAVPLGFSQYFTYGLDLALAPFPLHQLFTTLQATINNNTVSINMRDVLPMIVRQHDRRQLMRYNGYTPVAFDTISNYADVLGTNSNPLGAWSNNADNDLVPRGSWVLDSISSLPNAVAPVPAPNGTSRTIYFNFTVTEPLLVSPFIYADPKSNNQGFYGVQSMTVQCNIGDASRVLRFAQGSNIASVAVNQVIDPTLLFNFLTPHPSDLLPARNVVPYYELPRYISSGFASIPSGGQVSLQTQTIQLNQIPDKLYLWVRKALGTQSGSDPDFFLTISGLSINFNNNSGLLSSATQQDLYKYAVENGSNQSWYEFSGRANVIDPTSTGAGRAIATSGSLIVLEFGKDIQLVEDFYSAGSLGNFNIQINNIQVTNQTNQSITPEIVLVTMNSGVFVNERGTSSVYTGILTKADVLDASSQEPYTRSDVARMVGGGFLDNLKSVAGKLLPKLPSVAKAVLGQVDNKYAKGASDVLGAMGFGKSGAGMAGAGMSGAGVSGGRLMGRMA